MPVSHAVEVLFWLALGIVVYAYAGYGVCVRILALLRPRPAREGSAQPTVSLIVPAYNEASYLASKLENSLALDYPPDRFEILVISSGSSDGTELIANGYGAHGVRTLIQPTRGGKEMAMQEAARHAKGEILVFTDANVTVEPESFTNLDRYFADPEVGCVCGHLLYLNREQSVTAATGADYWRLEEAIKQLESDTGS